MKKRKSGDIVLIGSISADNRGEDSSVYVATKAGMQGFAESFRKEAARVGVRVSLIEPGQVGSDMQEETPKQQREKIRGSEMLRAEDVAVAVHYVLTQPARCVLASMTIVPLKQGLK
jgi:NADP-dependent 3-hydroxy acid dehydrogenase YdfG